jgi:hypothetical protein
MALLSRLLSCCKPQQVDTNPARQRLARLQELVALPRSELVALVRQHCPATRVNFSVKRPALIATILDAEYGPTPSTYRSRNGQ